MPQIFKYKKIILLVAVTLGLLWTISLTSKTRESNSFFERVIGYIEMPFQKAFNYVGLQINETYSFFHEIGVEKGEKERLSLRVQVLEDDIRKLQDIQKENNRLKQMLGLKDDYKGYQLENAQIIGRNPENWDSIIIVNKGSENGVKVNDVVISSNRGLVGRVIETSTSWSKVMLITDSDSSVSSIIDRTRELAVVRGDAFANKYGYVKLAYVLPDADVITDDIIVTSGMGGVFPKGILIGKVKEVKQESNELTKYAYIEPAADLKRLEEVVILKPAPPQAAQNVVKKGKK